ncbi:dTDP-4-amino-4,6-dideoxygalactose transaminase [Mesonia aquimarina]|uniref:dTDP-4-amino-4,6-dideoxygalactose transaminase n=1 Tax=Mesonia aquimarina TaxID=1504967 RepID=UPI0013CEB0E5|nr:dTDP-4-amino-4,6-dideoxygalactose transaminase [Mesonia aquimarina]
MNIVPFNIPHTSSNDLFYLADLIHSKKFSGNGKYTQKCQTFFEEKYNFKKSFLTTSCTAALEMTALLLDCKDGDEIIIPSYTFVSTALAFVREGAKVIFADSCLNNPNLDIEKLSSLITPKTKAIVIVHYAGISVNMNDLLKITKKFNLVLIEDAAQAIHSFYQKKPLGSFGHLATFSFHETKNIHAGEGGLLVVNDKKYIKRAEILWEKGTNRMAFFRGEIPKYEWIDKGSSFLPSEITAAFLYSQLLDIEDVTHKRLVIWQHYYNSLLVLKNKNLIDFLNDKKINEHNAHIFFILCNSKKERDNLISYLKNKGIQAVFHYQALHQSKFHLQNNSYKPLPNAEKYSDRLLRLPIFYSLSINQQNYIITEIYNFFKFPCTN